MGKASLTIVAIASLALLAGGCQSKMHQENRALHAQNRELQQRLNESQTRLREAPDPAEASSMRQQLADREAKIRDLEKQLQTGAPAAAGGNDPGIAGIETRYDPKAGTMTVTVPGDVLFESGQAALKPTARTTLDKVAAAIKKDYANRLVYIDGHTDADPINRTKDKWADNWELSAERARAVLNHLKTQGVTEQQMVLRAYGPNKPRNPSNKAANRRVEIVVVTG